MIRILLLAGMAFLIHFDGLSQKLSGQWTGGFTSSGNPYADKTEYVLELEIKNENVTGYSYTYFNLGSKRCFTICKLSGSYDKGSKSLVVKEVEKIKGNTPPDFQDCLQTHSLTYLKSEGKEVLVGKWKPAFEKNNCGTGSTELERKQLVKVIPQSEKKENIVKSSAPAKKNINQQSIVKTTPKPSTPKEKQIIPIPESSLQKSTAEYPKSSPVTGNAKANTSKDKESIIEKTKPTGNVYKDERFIKRNKQIIKTIDVEQKTFKVELYDNGQIDGDTVSLYLNGRLMVSRQRLSTNPISLVIDLSDDEEQELVMYAENLGTIPPNTALMVVTIGDKRYEVNITSSEQTNGAVRFVRKK